MTVHNRQHPFRSDVGHFDSVPASVPVSVQYARPFNILMSQSHAFSCSIATPTLCPSTLFRMALSWSFFPLRSVLLLGLGATTISAATVTYDFNITWVTTNPDGLFPRTTIGVNNRWPLPVITATKGDQIVVNVNNQLGNQSTSLHFHGLFQNGTAAMDGAAYVTQCPIQPGSSFTYNFTVGIRGEFEGQS